MTKLKVCKFCSKAVIPAMYGESATLLTMGDVSVSSPQLHYSSDTIAFPGLLLHWQGSSASNYSTNSSYFDYATNKNLISDEDLETLETYVDKDTKKLKDLIANKTAIKMRYLLNSSGNKNRLYLTNENDTDFVVNRLLFRGCTYISGLDEPRSSDVYTKFGILTNGSNIEYYGFIATHYMDIPDVTVPANSSITIKIS